MYLYILTLKHMWKKEKELDLDLTVALKNLAKTMVKFNRICETELFLLRGFDESELEEIRFNSNISVFVEWKQRLKLKQNYKIKIIFKTRW